MTTHADELLSNIVISTDLHHAYVAHLLSRSALSVRPPDFTEKIVLRKSRSLPVEVIPTDTIFAQLRGQPVAYGEVVCQYIMAEGAQPLPFWRLRVMASEVEHRTTKATLSVEEWRLLDGKVAYGTELQRVRAVFLDACSSHSTQFEFKET